MSLFARMDRAQDLPEPASTFLARRREWARRWIGWCVSGPEWVGFGWATDEMRDALRARGGSWTTGRLVFSLDDSGGIEITEEAC